MKGLKKGPEINLSKLKPGNLKVPKPVGDLYREVKGQHLLPIIVLLIVGLVAIPVLIGGSSDRGKSANARRQATIHGKPTKQVALDVSRWTPGLLDYKKSLRGAHRTDPFVARVPGYGNPESESSSGEVDAPPPPAEIETGGGGEETGGGGETGPTPIEPAPGGASNGGAGGNEGGEGSEGHGSGSEEGSGTGVATIDVHIFVVHQDGGVDRKPVRHDLPPQTKLPSDATPALTYVGPSDDGQKALMALSKEVSAILGDSNCVAPGDPCSLLALQVGKPETIVYGPNGLTLRVVLARVGESTGSEVGSEEDNSSGQGTGAGSGTGSAPAPRGANALIGVGGRHIVERVAGF